MSAEPGSATEGIAGRLARVHLRTGMLRLARVELEELAGEGRLDADGVLDLAEARWRTGDLRGAAEAAGAWLDAGAGMAGGAATRGDRAAAPARDLEAGRRAIALAHAMVAEGLTARGRHDDAAVHVAATLDALRGAAAGSLASALDAMFAGISPRADAWPAFEPGEPGPEPAAAGSGPRPATIGLPVSRILSPAVDPAPDPIAAAAERLAAGDDAGAAVLLLLALRAAPGRASEVLERADAALATRPGAPLLLARAEALRALGRHDAARIAYAGADTHARGAALAPSRPQGAGTDDSMHAPGTAPVAGAAPDPERRPQ